MSLPNLATELQDLIIKELHPTAALALGATNKYYHESVTLNRLHLDSVRRFLWELEIRSENQTKDGVNHHRFPCFKCFSMKAGGQFAWIRVVGSCYQQYSGDNHIRQCLSCDLADGLVSVGKVYFSWGNVENPKYSVVICTNCAMPQDQFCRGCHCCVICLEKKATASCADCGWCEGCVSTRRAEWERRKDEDAEDNPRDSLKMEGACHSHYPSSEEDSEAKQLEDLKLQDEDDGESTDDNDA